MKDKKYTNLNLNDIKKVGLVARSGKDMARDVDVLQQALSSLDVQILFADEMANELNVDGYALDFLARECGLIISLGGDGTLISLARRTAKVAPLLLGVHTGRLGFLTETTLDEVSWLFAEIFAGNIIEEQPYFLQVNIKYENGKNEELLALNDAVIMRSKPASIANIKAFLGGKHFNSYFGDGIIASTATGSTAYNMSAGGAIIYPLSDVFSLTPICSHSLTQRPLILPSSETVSLMADEHTELVIDGQESFSMQGVSSVEVGLSGLRARFLRHKERDYFQILKQKLRWGDK